MPVAPRSQAASRTQMTEYVLPQHANALGSVFGGQIMGWVDLCAAICAQRHSGRMAVTAFVDDLKFEQPVRIGEVVPVSRSTATPALSAALVGLRSTAALFTVARTRIPARAVRASHGRGSVA